MSVEKKVDEQMEFLLQGGTVCIPEDGLRKKLVQSLETGRPLRIKQGIDPTSPFVHIGHMVPFSLMRRFQDLGHQGIVIIGDITAGIGDPTGRNAERLPLDAERIRQNSETYTKQIFSVVDAGKTQVHFQSSWFKKFALHDIIRLMGEFSVAQLLAHETFRKRMEDQSRLSLHELFYPILQAWDSVEVAADFELGGSDQTFNIMCGRDLMSSRGMEPQVAMIVPLLSGLDGRKMSKSFGNDVPVLLDGFEQFCRIMSLGDSLMPEWRTLLSVGGEILADPMQEKTRIARELVGRFHSPGIALEAEGRFVREISLKEIPRDIPDFFIKDENLRWFELVRLAAGISASEAKRMIAQGGVKMNGNAITAPEQAICTTFPFVLKIGKRFFLKIHRRGQ